MKCGHCQFWKCGETCDCKCHVPEQGVLTTKRDLATPPPESLMPLCCEIVYFMDQAGMSDDNWRWRLGALRKIVARFPGLRREWELSTTGLSWWQWLVKEVLDATPTRAEELRASGEMVQGKQQQSKGCNICDGYGAVTVDAYAAVTVTPDHVTIPCRCMYEALKSSSSGWEVLAKALQVRRDELLKQIETLREQHAADVIQAHNLGRDQARMTPQQREEQRRSFAFGNVAIHNPDVTRELIDRVADDLKKA